MTPGLLHPDSRLRRLVRCALPGALIAVLIVLGLIGMHGIGTHGTPGSTPARFDAAPVSSHVHGDAAGAAVVNPGVVAGAEGHADGHQAMAMACVIILLLMARLLVPPGRLTRWAHRVHRPWVANGVAIAAAFPRPPSLHALCVSRT